MSIEDRFKILLDEAMSAPAGDAIVSVCLDVAEMLVEKNRKYGNSALNPVRIFSKASADEQMLVRMDDKLSRIKTSDPDDQEDAYKDLLGYLVLFLVRKKNPS